MTENTYKSVLSILEVMFDDDKITEQFKNEYPNLYVGDKEFKGFSIKVNPTDKTQWEESLIPSDSEYKFIRIEIDKSLVIATTAEVEKVERVEGETYTKDDLQTQNLDILPKTGEKTNGFLIVLYIIVGVCSICLLALLLIKRKRK